MAKEGKIRHERFMFDDFDLGLSDTPSTPPKSATKSATKSSASAAKKAKSKDTQRKDSPNPPSA
jgi:hypothetical protein